MQVSVSREDYCRGDVARYAFVETQPELTAVCETSSAKLPSTVNISGSNKVFRLVAEDAPLADREQHARVVVELQQTQGWEAGKFSTTKTQKLELRAAFAQTLRKRCDANPDPERTP